MKLKYGETTFNTCNYETGKPLPSGKKYVWLLNWWANWPQHLLSGNEQCIAIKRNKKKKKK